MGHQEKHFFFNTSLDYKRELFEAKGQVMAVSIKQAKYLAARL